MSYLGTDVGGTVGGIASAASGLVSSIAGAIFDYRAIGYQQEAAGTARQYGMTSFIEEEEYRRLQQQRDSELAKAEAEARQAIDSALEEQEEQIRREIVSTREEQLHSVSAAAHGRGRGSSTLLWAALGLGGVGLAIGGAFLLSRAGE